MMGTDIGRQLVKFAVETEYKDIPRDVLEFTKVLILKTIAGILAGSTKPCGRNMAKFIKDRKLSQEVGVIGCGFKTSLWEAVFLHAFCAHASELEDDRFGAGISWDITVIPILLSLVERLRLTGKALIEAVAVGLEVHVRTCLSSTEHLGVLVVPGAVGPAVAAAKALGLSTEEMTSAFGLAISGVPLARIQYGTDAHYFESALHSLQGIIAAEMAKEGMTSNSDIIAYLSNLLGTEKVIPETMVADLGRRWLFCDISIKKYPCCFGIHRQIDALLEIMRDHDLSYGQIDTITVHASSNENKFLNRAEPKSEGDLQFSIQHNLAAAMLDRDVNLSHFHDAALMDQRLINAYSKIRIICHPEWSREPNASPTSITVKTRDGREFIGERMFPIGSPQEPLTTEQLRDLYSKFTKVIMSEKQITGTANLIMSLEKLNDLTELMEALVFTYKI